MSKFPADLWEALNGKKGALDGYLEVHNEQEVREHILALLEHKGGETLRDEFAGKAMQAIIIANPIYGTPEGNVSNSRAAISDRAYQMADAMLTARGAGDKT